MPRHKKKQLSDDNVSTTSLTRAQRAKVLEKKRRAAVSLASLAQEKRTNPAPHLHHRRRCATHRVTSPLSSTGVSPRLPPFDHARLRERVPYKSYADNDGDSCMDIDDNDYNPPFDDDDDDDVDEDGVPLARVVDEDDDGGG